MSQIVQDYRDLKKAITATDTARYELAQYSATECIAKNDLINHDPHVFEGLLSLDSVTCPTVQKMCEIDHKRCAKCPVFIKHGDYQTMHEKLAKAEQEERAARRKLIVNILCFWRTK